MDVNHHSQFAQRKDIYSYSRIRIQVHFDLDISYKTNFQIILFAVSNLYLLFVVHFFFLRFLQTLFLLNL